MIFFLMIMKRLSKSNAPVHPCRNVNSTEQIGSDAFHYQEKYIYFFIYDKHRVIANVDAFSKAYSKSLDTHEKQIETVIIQPISF
ncbi:hypothetical protein [Brevibacillus agri]|uniref:PD-(D/E)XK nuclease domain-containing protein n=2 Tax=Brevibacillus agri TaxID=51101 RepID=UPI00399D2C3C